MVGDKIQFYFKVYLSLHWLNNNYKYTNQYFLTLNQHNSWTVFFLFKTEKNFIEDFNYNSSVFIFLCWIESNNYTLTLQKLGYFYFYLLIFFNLLLYVPREISLNIGAQTNSSKAPLVLISYNKSP